MFFGFTGFVMADDTPASLSRPATPTSMGHTGSVGGAKSPEDISSDRLHLILGRKLVLVQIDQTGKRVFISVLCWSCVPVRDQHRVSVFSALRGSDGEHHFLSASSAGAAGRRLAPSQDRK